ncbi:antibiotic biosynthesis monooxygenase family protein [Weissella halotolerans]|uniref:ABM domain-containing protein n=1 Tax=Weissella halotolerans DSM 20190 TaxID=1123500 RepID=A0A0R2G4F0_9LACO|nr:hypothetical protein [Weissella halotolerans]KRN31700.1 hypothetical protein IV68_GL000956 [Weissella halotolerans DSM 20190]
MPEYLHTTFGSKEVLTAIRNQHLNQHLLLTVDDADPYRYQLIEKTSDSDSVFTTPTSYEILSEQGETAELRGWLNFHFITVPEQGRANFIRRWNAFQERDFTGVAGFISSYLLQRVDEPQQLAVLTTWTMKDFWLVWQADNQSPLKDYQTEGNRYGLRDAQYSFVAFAKQDLK